MTGSPPLSTQDVGEISGGRQKLLEIENGQTELGDKRTDGIEVDGSVNELDGEGKEKKGMELGT